MNTAHVSEKLHTHSLMIEDIILLCASVYLGRVSENFDTLADCYSKQLHTLFKVPKDQTFKSNVAFGNWLIERRFDGFLCQICVPRSGTWEYCFFYGDSIDDCVNQAILCVKL